MKWLIPLLAAAHWSTPAAYDPATCKAPIECVSEPAPRVAINAKGAAVATWIDTRDRVRAAIAKRPGRFGPAHTLDESGLRPAAAVAPDGTVTVVWTHAGTLRFARNSGPAKRLVARGDKDGDDVGRIAAQPDGSVVVVYESGDNVRALTISPTGIPGAPVTLGKGGFDHDSVRVAPDGTLAACCIQPTNRDPNVPPDTAEKIATYRANGGWQLVSAPAVEIETVYGTANALALGILRVESSGDAGEQGAPGLARAGADNVFAAPAFGRVKRETRGLAPDVTIDGSGRSVLVFQEKDGPQPFNREAPVYASVAARARQTLTTRRAYQPTVRPLGPGAIAVWQDTASRWGVAIERDGRFRTGPEPSGPGPDVHLGEDFNYAYDFAASGNHAVLTWVAADGSIRVSELREALGHPGGND